MGLIEQLSNLATLDQLIRFRNTGTVDDLAEKLGASSSTVKRLIAILRLFVERAGGKILYDKERRTYYYDPPGYFTIRFIIKK
jgi:predicted transcriptional regulator